MKARNYFPAVAHGAKWYPEDIVGSAFMNDTGNYWFVDGDKSASGSGTSWEDAFYDVESAVNNTSLAAGDTIFIAARTMSATSTDPVSYTENAVLDTPSVSLIGVSRGRAFGGLPQLKVGGTTTSPIISIKAPGCLIANLGINGAGATGGGIRLYDDGGTTYASFGTTIAGCHFKNCKGSAAASTGGAIYVGSGDNCPWNVYITGNNFFNCRAGIVVPNSPATVGQDWVIENNVFGSTANTTVDADIYLGTSSVEALQIIGNTFATVDVPGYATSPDAARYIYMNSGVEGVVANNFFACIVGEGETEKTFAASSSTACQIPTTVRMAGNWGETSTGGASVDFGMVFRTP